LVGGAGATSTRRDTPRPVQVPRCPSARGQCSGSILDLFRSIQSDTVRRSGVIKGQAGVTCLRVLLLPRPPRHPSLRDTSVGPLSCPLLLVFCNSARTSRDAPVGTGLNGEHDSLLFEYSRRRSLWFHGRGTLIARAIALKSSGSTRARAGTSGTLMWAGWFGAAHHRGVVFPRGNAPTRNGAVVLGARSAS